MMCLLVYTELKVAVNNLVLCAHRTDRKNPHPGISMEDLLNPVRCRTLDNLAGDMVYRMQCKKVPGEEDEHEGMWYSIPVAVSRSQHLCSDESWKSLLQRLRQRMQARKCVKMADLLAIKKHRFCIK